MNGFGYVPTMMITANTVEHVRVLAVSDYRELREE